MMVVMTSVDGISVTMEHDTVESAMELFQKTQYDAHRMAKPTFRFKSVDFAVPTRMHFQSLGEWYDSKKI